MDPACGVHAGQVTMRRAPLLLLSALIPGSVGGQAAAPVDEAAAAIDAAAIRAHTAFLADDLLEGRAPGSRGGRLAERYIAAQFQRIGLLPIDGSYLQPVPLIAWTAIRAENAPIEARAGTTAVPLISPSDVVVWNESAAADADIGGELVFAGYGIAAPEWQWDDYKGADLSGKVVLFLVGEPPPPPTEPDLFDGFALTYYGRWTYKLEEAVRRGAAGALLVHSADAAGYDWPVVEASWHATRYRLADAAPGLAAAGWIRRAAAVRLLAAAGVSLDELVVRAARRDFRPLPTGVSVRVRPRGTLRAVTAHNVIGILPGAAAGLRDETLIYTAHHDHLGIGPAIAGDSIYNGAYDNASGVALLLAVGEAFARLQPRPARSILFVATTAEEAGLLGARRYAAVPARPLANTVAVLNLEGASLWGETQDITAIGADRSTLGRAVDRVARRTGVEPLPDPTPQAGYYFRADHFPFARAGVPGLTLQHGVRFRGRPESFGPRTLADYLEHHYHRPSDELRAAFRFDGAAQQADFAFRLGLDIALDPALPIWLPGGQPVVPPAPAGG